MQRTTSYVVRPLHRCENQTIQFQKRSEHLKLLPVVYSVEVTKSNRIDKRDECDALEQSSLAGPRKEEKEL